MATIGDLVTSAFRELGIVGLVDTPGEELSALGLGLLNRTLDRWNVTRRAVYADVHAAPVALTPATNPHTIGPSGATITATRPVSIEGIRLTTDNGETYHAPLCRRDAAWWHSHRTPGTAGDLPTEFYYDPTFPSGSIYFDREPSSASVKAQIWSRVVLAQVALTDTLSVPPGYHEAMLETLKESLVALPMFASAGTGDIKERARQAREVAFAGNATIRPLTNDLAGVGGVFDVTLGPYSLMGR